MVLNRKKWKVNREHCPKQKICNGEKTTFCLQDNDSQFLANLASFYSSVALQGMHATFFCVRVDRTVGALSRSGSYMLVGLVYFYRITF